MATNEYFMFQIGNVKKGNPDIAAFDLDWTIIKTKSLTSSGKLRKFPLNYNDWQLFNNFVKPSLQKLSKNYKIVIITNQGSKKFNKEQFFQKMTNISKELEIPIQVLGCTNNGFYRKPSVGLWNILEKNNDNVKIDMKSSFYVGDAAGREGDFANTDYKFALNLGLKFYTPEEFFKKIPLEFIDFEPRHPLLLSSNNQYNIEPKDTQEMIILVGPPASGKSTLAKNFNNYTIVCQDDLKSKKKVLELVEKSLAEGLSVVVDRKNEYVKSRKELLEIAEQYNIPVRILWLDIPKELAQHLNAYRLIVAKKEIPSIVFNKYYSPNYGLEKPTTKESKCITNITNMNFYIDDDSIQRKNIFYSYLI